MLRLILQAFSMSSMYTSVFSRTAVLSYGCHYNLKQVWGLRNSTILSIWFKVVPNSITRVKKFFVSKLVKNRKLLIRLLLLLLSDVELVRRTSNEILLSILL